MKLAALNQLVEQGPGIWQSSGPDPQFAVQLPKGGLGSGWYVVDLQMRTCAGEPVSPALYPDYGNGISEATRIALTLALDNAGRGGQVVCFNDRVRSVRFDPATAPTVFELGHFKLRAIGRVRAAWLMLGALAARGDGWSWVLRRAAKELSGGLPGFAQWLHGNYYSDSAGHVNDYGHWLRLYDRPLPVTAQLPAVPASAQPLISVVMPVYNTASEWLRRCIESVREQTYPHWELCIADDASTQPQVRAILEHYTRIDARIKVVYRPANGHISDASNSALALAEGQFVALLDHDDELHPAALAEIASAIERHPRWQLIYSDEDKIDSSGRRFEPYFKPDWNYDLLLSQNYFSHFGVFSADLLREVGGFRKGFEGSQDHDLVLRCIEKIDPATQLGHVPRVLYHWRAIAGSTAMAVGEKQYAVDAGVRSIRDHLQRIGSDATVVATERGHYRVRYALPATPPKVSLIIPTRDRVDLLRLCLGSILGRTRYPDFEILVLDNQSAEPETLDYFRELAAEPRVRILPYDAPFNFSAINNHGVRHAAGEIIGLVNNDIEVINDDWLEEMVSHALRPGVGAVGAMLYYPDDRIQHAGVILGVHGVGCHPYSAQPRGHTGQCARALLVQSLSAVTAACLVIRKQVFEQVSGLDEALQVAFNDVDLCLRVRQAGYANVWTPFAELYHHESASRGVEDTPEKQARFAAEVEFMTNRWGEALANDPAYNPNLTLDGEPFSLAFPPRRIARQ